MFIPRIQLQNLKKLLLPNKVVVLAGARRVGKTTLIKKLIEELNSKNSLSQKILLVNGDDIFERSFLESQSIQKLKDFIGQNKILIIDEAQYISQIGLNLKLIVDHIPDIKIIITGSSSLNIAGEIGEPLTGRKFDLRLFPIAQMELNLIENTAQTAANLENRLIFGSYPEIVITADIELKKRLLKEIVNSFLLKDILQVNGIKYSNKLISLLQLLALQIGQTISFNELGAQLGFNRKTIERYLDLLEKTYIIYRLQGFSKNLRKEISKNPKYYFWDNGIRNALIANFNPLHLRNDVGALWKNYIISELLKKDEYGNRMASFYFWRTYDKQEIDLIEIFQSEIFAYEIKWTRQKLKPPAAWQKNYPQSHFNTITPQNYLKFIS